MRMSVSLRFQFRVEELQQREQFMLVLAACYAIGSIDRMIQVGALVADPVSIAWLRGLLPQRNGGRLVGAAAHQRRDEIRRWGFSVGGTGWKDDLAARVTRGPVPEIPNEGDSSPPLGNKAA